MQRANNVTQLGHFGFIVWKSTATLQTQLLCSVSRDTVLMSVQ